MSELKADNPVLFLSWSGKKASLIAPAIKSFLEDVIAVGDIFLSHDIGSGSRWSDEIGAALRNCDAGLVLLTAENISAPWLYFEAGALSKKLEEARVIPILCDITIGEVAGTPLNQFQAKSLTKDEFVDACVDLGFALGVSKEAVLRRFEVNWPTLQGSIEKLNTKSKSSKKAAEPSIKDVYSVLENLSARLGNLEEGINSLQRSTAIPAARRNALQSYEAAFFGRPRGTVLASDALGLTDSSATKGDILRSVVDEYMRERDNKSLPSNEVSK